MSDIKTNVLNVLVVDDDRLFCEQLEKELRRNFFKTFSSLNGKTALEIFTNESIDIVIIDARLPDMSGLELLTKMKELKSGFEVIIITGYGAQDVAIESLRRGAIDYIEKPIKLDELSAAIGRAQEKLINKEELTYKYKILVIDNEKDVVNRLKKCIEKENYEVFAAYSGTEGLEIVDKNKIDIIVTDIKMDDINGIEVFKRAKVLFPDIEGIVVTGFRERELAINALRAGAMDYITKPIDLDELFFSLKRAAEKISLHRNRIFRNRELRIATEITSKLNQELENKIKERTIEISKIQSQLFQTSKLATLGEMSAGLAHEINQPLGGISLIAKSFRKMLAAGKLTKEEIESGLFDIEMQIKRMTKIIQHIRTFARQDTLKFIQVDLKETVLSALSLLSEQLRIQSVDVEIEIDDNLPKIVGEPYQLEQVWINLISNARDAMLEKENMIKTGKLDSKDYRKRLRITSSIDKEFATVAISISDNGSGISEDVISRIFEPFYTTKEVGKATGLGLSISYGIIENHIGKIQAFNNKDEGTTIMVTLPAGETNND